MAEMVEAARTTGTVEAPLFSVVIPTLDRADLLPRAVAAVLGQSETSLELVIVDDGSRDATAEIVAAMSDPRIVFLQQGHQGVSAARNAGAARARGRYLTFLDSDDAADPEWLAAFRRAFEAGADVVCCGTRIFAEGEATEEVRLPGDLGPPYGHREGLFLTGTFALRREVYEALGGYDAELRCSENTDLALRLTARLENMGWHLFSLAEPLMWYHKQPYRWSAEERLFRYQMDAARRILERHGEKYRRPHPRGYANYCALVGVNAARLGHPWTARRYLLRAVLAYPRRLANWSRFFIALLPAFLGRPFWLRKQDD